MIRRTLMLAALALAAQPAMEFMQATAKSLHDPSQYVEAVMSLSREAGR